jgi:pimeloyl-ACP methyl ester carboxylesterase
MSSVAETWHNFAISPFLVTISDEVLDDLRSRIRATRWPDPAPGDPWSQGTDLAFLRDLLAYWADGFDWPAQQRALNVFAHFTADLGDAAGATVHFVHERARSGAGFPLVLTHGWPSTFAEMLPLVPLLTDPGAYGIPGPGFDVVIPSLPGYGFSPRPARTGVDYRFVADRWHRLMRGLGYERFGATGTDFGAGVAAYLGRHYPESVVGIHLSTLELSPVLDERSHPLSDEEQAFVVQRDQWDAVERGYSAIQSTKPQTVGYGLNDSPAGLAAWLVEKWRSWSDSGGELDRAVPRDTLLTMLTVYWATQTITSSMRDYYDTRWSSDRLRPGERIDVPAGFAVFSHEYVQEGKPVRAYAERLFDVRRWTEMPRGGHFAAVEAPDLLARDIAAFFNSVLGRSSGRTAAGG